MRVGNNDQWARTVELVPGKGRTSIKFDGSTWAAIDLVARKNGMKWQEWARKIVTAHPDAKNMAGTIRAALTDELLGEISRTEHSYSRPNSFHPMLAGFSVADDKEFQIEFGAARIEYSQNFGAFVLHAGYRAEEFGGQPVLFIENLLRGELSLVLTQAEVD